MRGKRKTSLVFLERTRKGHHPSDRHWNRFIGKHWETRWSAHEFSQTCRHCFELNKNQPKSQTFASCFRINESVTLKRLCFETSRFYACVRPCMRACVCVQGGLKRSNELINCSYVNRPSSKTGSLLRTSEWRCYKMYVQNRSPFSDALHDS